jgi:hypothetical protein
VKKSILVLPFALLAAALALSACGGGGSSSSGSSTTAAKSPDETAIEKTIQSDATSTSPSKCTKYVTQEANEQQSGASGAEATEACEAEAGEGPAESVAVSNIDVEGESATAEAAVKGSALNGQSLELELVKEGGDWKINQFLSFTKFDPKALGDSIEAELEETGEVAAPEVKCFAEGVSGMSQGEAEEIAFEGNLKPLEELGCEE